MKLALITDTHAGVRQDSHIFLDVTKKFLDEIFFPKLKEEGITQIIHLGDLVDKRKFININTLSRLKKDFIQPIEDNGYELHWILGNHDIFYRENMSVNAADEFFKDHKSIRYYKKPYEFYVDGKTILFLPWICNENLLETTVALADTTSKVLFGHLELVGFEMFKGMPAQHGENPNLFSQFDVVCSGHYHHRSSCGNIHYLGSHADFTWADFDDPRGFHIFDTEDNSLTFVENTYTVHRKVFYDDKNTNWQKIKFTDLKDKYVKVIVTNRNDLKQYDWFITQIINADPIEYLVLQDHFNMDKFDTVDLVNETNDTLTIIRDYVNLTGNNINTTKLDNLFLSLYHEAVNV